MRSVPPARPNAWVVTNSAIQACSTHKLRPLHIASEAIYHIEIGFQQGLGDGSCVTGRMNRQIGICDDVSISNALPVLSLLCVSFYLISVTKLWHMIICLCMCKGQIGHANVLDIKSHWLTTNECDIVLPINIKWDNSNSITDETRRQNLSQWCHTSHRCSGQSAIRSWMNDYLHASYDHGSNCIMGCTDLVHIVGILKIAYGRSWKSRRMSWMRKGEEVWLRISKTSVRIYMWLIAGQKLLNVMGQRQLSLR